ncbi:MAG: hypothetical protein LUG99_11085 [Lachnospiraceae bacterium]|nr:hypothetical protein [Lachnospiraceae bacterium]
MWQNKQKQQMESGIFKIKDFENPPAKYRMKAIIHAWPRQPDTLLDALQAFGYGGTATNPSFENGYTSNRKNLRDFDSLLKKIRARGLGYWIYDENGYPSGYAGGQTLSGHPEFEAKGFYMVRRIAYEPKTVVFDLDDESDKIIWAAKYPLDCSVLNASIVKYEEMEAIEFSEKRCVCQMEAGEAFFVFCVKCAYEGSHCVHNVCSHSRYINLLNPDAVKRFLEVNYETIAADVPDAYTNAEAVFTDEPSLMVGYMHGEETWPYALAPWTEGLFEAFEDEYGFSLIPYLPMIFEGRSSSYSIRIQFYNLIGKLIARSYVRQISNWCRAHGTIFSGHYLAEESLMAHVLYYGSYLEVLKETDYPGVDILASYPEIFNYNTPKFAQMAARKSGTDGVMVELCPFINLDYFSQRPIPYARGILNLMILGGCRRINSYFAPDFAQYAPEQLADYKGYMDQSGAKALNEYAGRILCLLDGVQNETGTFLYYAIEEAQAKLRPSHCAPESESSEVDRSLRSISTKMYEAGFDYMFCDKDDLVQAAQAREGIPVIGNQPVREIILPAMDVIYEASWEALKSLRQMGVKVWFAEKLPPFRAEKMAPFAYYDFREESALKEVLTRADSFDAMNEQEILDSLRKEYYAFRVSAQSKECCILKAAYRRDGNPFYFLVNNSEEDAYVNWEWDGANEVTLLDPGTGEIRAVNCNEPLQIRSYQGIFLMSDV